MFRSKAVSLCLITLFVGVSAVGAPPKLVRPLTQEEAQADFRQLVGQVKSLYGPLVYKEKRFGYKLDDLVQASESDLAKAKTDAEYFGVFKQFLGKLEDGHVSITFVPHGVASYKIPLFVTPIEDRAIVATVPADITGVAVGDELISIDGKRPSELLPIIEKYEALGNPLTDKHYIYKVLDRPFYLTELRPKSASARLVFQKPTGKEVSLELTWRLESSPLAPPLFAGDFVVGQANDLNRAAGGTLMAMGANDPFFFTPEAMKKFGIARVVPHLDFLTKYGIADKTLPPIYAAIYRYQGKNILFVRQPTYMVTDPDVRLKYFQALFDQFDDLADVLVLDQTHNPGGSIDYANKFFSLFLNERKAAMVQHMHADRKWIVRFQEFAKTADPTLKSEVALMNLAHAREIERAYDLGLPYTAPMPILGGNYLEPAADYHWDKPVLMLTDELAGSCGDIVPMLMKRNGRAKLFGQRTIGLGGNVEDVGRLSYSGATVNLTRGLFTSFREDGQYLESDLVENNGILPDYVYDHTVADFRAGFVAYVEALSARAIEQ